MISLRYYQREALDALYSHWARSGGNSLIVLPTASGKTPTMATMIREIIEKYPNIRICVVTHVKELITQGFFELMRIWPNAPAGIYSAGLGKRDARQQIVYCGIQSVHNKVDRLGDFDLLVIDEVHLVGRDAETTYGKFIAALHNRTPDMRIVGYTATPWRTNSGRLDKGDGALFEKIVYEYGISQGIEDGFLCPPVSKATLTTIDMTGVGVRGGDYIPAQLEIAVDTDFITKQAVDEIIAYGKDRKGWIVFCTGVDHAKHVCEEIRSRGIDAECVIGNTSGGDRDRILNNFKARKLRCIVVINIGTTGFNATHVDLIAGLRPTKSKLLYLQMVGRGLRLDNGKKNCLVLDFGKWVQTHGPIDMVKVSRAKLEKDSNEVRAKECPQCATLLALNTRQCPECDYVFKIAEPDLLPKHDARADSERAILSTAGPVWIGVDGVKVFRHVKFGEPNGLPTLRVEYSCGINIYKEWITVEHTGMAGSRARDWWRMMGGDIPTPRKVDEAIERVGELNEVGAIAIRPDGKWFRIVGHRMAMEDAA